MYPLPIYLSLCGSEFSDKNTYDWAISNLNCSAAINAVNSHLVKKKMAATPAPSAMKMMN